MLFDTHSHLNFKAFDNDRDDVISRSLQAGVFMINVGSSYETSKLAVEIAQKYEEGVYAAVALHPIHVQAISNLKSQIANLSADRQDLHLKSKKFETEEFSFQRFKALAKSSKKVVAIGETGLDAMYPDPKQEEVFLEHLKLAKELDLPVILHCRKAHQELIKILQTTNYKLPTALHCFTGKWSEAKHYLEMGLYLGFNGIIFKMDLGETIKKMPLEKMLLETDCPYLTPPQAGVERNEPLFVKYVAEKITELRQEPLEKIIEATAQNAKKLFKIKS